MRRSISFLGSKNTADLLKQHQSSTLFATAPLQNGHVARTLVNYVYGRYQMSVTIEQATATSESSLEADIERAFSLNTSGLDALFHDCFQTLIVFFKLREFVLWTRIKSVPTTAKRICTIHGSNGNGMTSAMLSNSPMLVATGGGRESQAEQDDPR